MELEIRDAERGTVVATVSDRNGLETDDELARDTIPVGPDGVVEYKYAVAGDDFSATARAELEPGDRGYLYAVRDSLPSPFEVAGGRDLEPPDV